MPAPQETRERHAAVPVRIDSYAAELSERYDFHAETIASLVLLSSVGSALTLNLWLLLLA